MAAKEDDEKIIKIQRQSFHFNIGMLVFIIILIYTLYFVARYFTTDHIMAYEVEEGAIAQNTTYTGLALRDETIYYTSSDGDIDYYVNEGSRVSVRTLVYSLDQTGAMSQFLEDYGDDLNNLDSSAVSKFDEIFNEYSNSYDNASFYTAYSFLKTTNDKLTENKNKKALDYLTASGDASISQGLTFYYADQPGVVVYGTDGYENVTEDTINTYMFRESNYVNNELSNGTSVPNGGVAYKLITSEDWRIIFPVDYDMAATLEEEGAIEVQFLKDNAISYANVKILYKEDGAYAVLSFSNSMVRYCTDRFLDIKIITDQLTGLKIPNSSIAEKDFFIVPKEYLTTGGDGSSNGFMKETTDENGETVLTFVACDIAKETDTECYVADEDLAMGDVLRKQDSSERYILSETEALQGVYNINKGYAVFKQIDPLYQNEEYTIISKDTQYGISQFDFIAIDATDIYEGEIVQ